MSRAAKAKMLSERLNGRNGGQQWPAPKPQGAPLAAPSEAEAFATDVRALLGTPASTRPSAVTLDFDQSGNLYAWASDMAPVRIARGDEGMAQLEFLIMDRRQRFNADPASRGFSVRAPRLHDTRAPYAEQELRHQAAHHVATCDGKPIIDTCPFCRAASAARARKPKLEITGADFAGEDFA